MSTTLYAAPASLVGTSVPKVCTQPRRSAWFGDLAIVAFLLVQALDGIFTYVGVVSFGPGIEANPIIAGLIGTVGSGPALTGAKVVAAVLGICLHLLQIHVALAALSAFYFTAAIVPWTAILFF